MGGGRTPLKIVFFGTPDYVLPVLTSLHKKFVTGPGKSPIVAVVTQPPRPTGRRQIKTYSPVDRWAHERKIPIYYDVESLIGDNIDAEVGVLESYGNILSKSTLDYFPKGIINIHPSLLPHWRGASPVPATIMAGDSETGGTVIKLDEKVDHGPILSQFKERVLPDDTTDSLRRRLFEKSADVITELLPAYLAGKIKLKPQDDSKATFTTRIKKEDGFVDLKKDDPAEIEKKLRAYYPWPGIWTQVDGKRLKILKAHLEEGKLVLDEVQLEGKNPVTWKQFVAAYPQFSLLS